MMFYIYIYIYTLLSHYGVSCHNGGLLLIDTYYLHITAFFDNIFFSKM